jgi:hypothetical protein
MFALCVSVYANLCTNTKYVILLILQKTPNYKQLNLNNYGF